MNNKIKIYCLLVFIPAILFFSCSEDEMSSLVSDGADDLGIVFRISMPEAESRSTNTTVESLLNDGFRVSAFCPEGSATGTLNPYFTEQQAAPLEGMAGHFAVYDQSSELCVWPSMRHDKQGTLKFFAFYPSRETMKEMSGANSDVDYLLKNNTNKKGNTITYDYRIEKFNVSNDISRHFDFVTATAEGSGRANSDTGVKLDFEHQLSRIELKAWANTVNDIEIAGVRIGCVITQSDFNFAEKPKNYAVGDATLVGNWVGSQKRGNVEYIFREGDTVIKIGNGSHTSKATAVSIMGNGGYAMIIPSNYSKWNHTGDASNTQHNLYFSVLLRIKENDMNRTLLYPYIEGAQYSGDVKIDNMNVVYFSIEKATGKIVKRLYRNKTTKSFFADPDLTEAYTASETEEIRNYGWAAIPFTRLWKPGYHYTYLLNYSDGVGVHDPAEPAPYPGKPIISRILVDVTEGEEKWPMVVDGFTKADSVDVKNGVIIE